MTMFNPDVDKEIRRLLDLMPASGRMNCKLVPQPKQSSAIVVPLPLPWTVVRPIFINLSLWLELPLPERDMTLLRAVAWLGEVRWWKGGAYPALTVVGFMASGVELVQGDAMGIVSALGLTAVTAWQIWRGNRSPKLELAADEQALAVAQRRGYSQTDAVRHLLGAIEHLAAMEGRSGLEFNELIRCQNLRAIARLSSVSVPDSLIR